MTADDSVSKASRLTDKSPNAYTHFYGGGTPCIFKSDYDCRASNVRLTRFTVTPVCPFGSSSASASTTTSTPLMYSGHPSTPSPTPTPRRPIPSALASSPLSVVTRSVAAVPKFLSFNPILDNVPDLQNPFVTALGVSVAPFKGEPLSTSTLQKTTTAPPS
ncbi:hypothetical protein CVT25_000483 [Psilocybe cyanescens]|uniref:Uncharacterized protein n=1 Tax=Psilocybe cyanescens TaxID=93625 RepID=A0A409XW94_PSICY|nr:hypothetical protein CVT25_000483 [Psilocybe cyanescens]